MRNIYLLTIALLTLPMSACTTLSEEDRALLCNACLVATEAQQTSQQALKAAEQASRQAVLAAEDAQRASKKADRIFRQSQKK